MHVLYHTVSDTYRDVQCKAEDDGGVDDGDDVSAGCSSLGKLPEHWKSTIISGGTADFSLPTQPRPFRLSVPVSYGTHHPQPLLLFFHGWGGTLSDGDAFHAHGRKQ